MLRLNAESLFKNKRPGIVKSPPNEKPSPTIKFVLTVTSFWKVDLPKTWKLRLNDTSLATLSLLLKETSLRTNNRAPNDTSLVTNKREFIETSPRTKSRAFIETSLFNTD